VIKARKRVYKVEFGSEVGAYLVTDGRKFLFYNRDGIIIATPPLTWRLGAMLGMVETADDFEMLTGQRPEVFLEDCRVCGQPALLFMNYDDGVCVDCSPEESDGEMEQVN
jgi:hypothetical protein